MTRTRWLLVAFLGAASLDAHAATGEISAADYPSIQAAIDANPGRMIPIPDGEHRISEELRIRTDGTGLYGFGTVVQESPERAVLRLEGATGVRVRDVTFTRAEGRQDATESGVMLRECRGAVLDRVRVLKCKARQAALDVVYNTGRDKVIRDGQPVEEPPRYRYALYIGPWNSDAAPGPTLPRNVVVEDNIFHPGTDGVSNVEP